MTSLDASVETQISQEIYQGQFGEFTITPADRRGVVVYRAGLMLAALCFGIGTTLALGRGDSPAIQMALTFLYSGFTVGLGVSLLTIHIYMARCTGRCKPSGWWAVWRLWAWPTSTRNRSLRRYTSTRPRSWASGSLLPP